MYMCVCGIYFPSVSRAFRLSFLNKVHIVVFVVSLFLMCWYTMLTISLIYFKGAWQKLTCMYGIVHIFWR
jgi:hypothetical protein